MGYTDEDLAKHKYIQFEGLDIDPSGVPYGSSIATEKAMDVNHCVMVAYEMNGMWIMIQFPKFFPTLFEQRIRYIIGTTL